MRIKNIRIKPICKFLFMMLLVLVCCVGVRVSVNARNNTIIIGTNAEYAPFEYLDSDGNLVGFDYEIVEAIAKEEGLKVKWKDLPFDSLVGAMETGDINVIAAAIGPTEERAKSVDFSEVYYTGSQSIVSRDNEGFDSFDALSRHSVAVLEGSLSDMIASGENTDYGKVKGAKVKRFKNASSAIMELKNGGVDTVIIDTIMAQIYCNQTKGIQYCEIEGTKEDTVFCIEKGNTALKQEINDGLAKIKKNGTYDELYKKYFSGELTLTDTSDSDGVLNTLKFVFVDESRWKYYVSGLAVTLIVSVISVLLGLIIGLIVAFARLASKRKNRKTIGSIIASVYVDIIRGTPSVLQLMIIYFVVFHSSMGYIAAVVCFGINSGAYVSEVIRAGIIAVDSGQMEAARSLGLSYSLSMKEIIIPQAVKNILPALGNEFIQLIKETSILGYVGIMDLTKASSYISSRTYQMFLPLIVAGIIYYAIVKALSFFLKKFERRLRDSD